MYYGLINSMNRVAPINPIWLNTNNYYSFNSTNVDLISAKNATLVGGVGYSAGILDNCIDFDGSNDYVTFPDDTLKFLGDFSFSFWMYKKTNGTQLYFSGVKSGDPYYGNGFFMYNSGGAIAIEVNGGSDLASAVIPLNTWTHIVFTHKLSTRNRWYINGVLSTSNTLTTNPNHLTGLITSNFGTSYYPNAKLQDVSVWNNYELTASEVIILYNSGSPKRYPL